MIGRWRVFLGFVAAAVFAAFSHAAFDARLAGGLAAAFAGLVLRGWAAGYLEKGRRLAQDGPYATWRHPLYAGSFLMALGFCAAGTGGPRVEHSFLVWCVFAVLFFGVYPRRMGQEEATLEKTFGDAWRDYRRKTFRFFPRFPPLKRAEPDRFQWARYRKNREYQAAVGYLAGAALLSVKAWLRL
jgi:protein-S-isoprenylcysteine O-methyltransferase Ste14